jgi:hypothetical protein
VPVPVPVPVPAPVARAAGGEEVGRRCGATERCGHHFEGWAWSWQYFSSFQNFA